MHHLYPLAKGDPLCPLGFHPQVRWPTRCKRCFRDYKEHGGRKREDDFAASTPALSTWNSTSSRARDEDNGGEKDKSGRNWSSTQNINQDVQKNKTDAFSSGLNRPKLSWTSTPDLGGLNDSTTAVTVSLKLPRKKTAPLPLDTGQALDTQNVITLRRPSASPPPPPSHLTINKNDSLAERVRKMQLLKAQSSFEKETSQERDKERRSASRSRDEEPKKPEKTEKPRPSTKDSDMNFLIQVKTARANKAKAKPPIRGGPIKDEKDGEVSDSSMDDDTLSTAGTTTTETTLVDHNTSEYQDQIDSLKEEMETLRKRCERVEKEKSDILLRRLANLDTTSSKIAGRSSELLKMQQKVNDLSSQNEDLKDDKKSLSLRVKEIETELEARPSPELAARQVEQLRSKLLAAETLCEELMDENEDMKKELRELEEEIEEMQDNFREDQADEYSSLRRELEQTIKNCRVLSFKLKKTERRAEALDQEKQEQEKKLLEIVGGQVGLDRVAKIKELEQEVARANEVALRMQRELQEANGKISQHPPSNQKKAPPLGTIGKTSSADGKLSRASLTRGGSQEDPQQLLRDLQDSLEREADLREQLKNAEEEAINLRKKASRVEDDNESLLLQLKKMATKARTRKLSPTAPINRLSIDASIEKDEGISDEEDPAELRILLELNEQEAAVLRRKVEELEVEGDSLKNQVRELAEKIASSPAKTTPITVKKNTTTKASGLSEEKIKVLESEIGELRKKLIEKERDCERLHAELSFVQKRPKGSLIKSKSLDSNSEQQNVDLKRQLQVIEQEASVLRTKTQTLEAENDKIQAENKKLQLLRGARTLKSDKSADQNAEKMTKLENELKEALAKVKEMETRVAFGGSGMKKDADALKSKQEELDKIKINLTKTEKERDKLAETLKVLKEDAIKSFKPRTTKRITDLTTKLQLKRMVEELENEIGEMFVIMKNAELNKTPAKASEKKELEKTISDIRSTLSQTEAELTNEKNKLQTEISKLKDLNAKLTSEKLSLLDKNKSFESEKSKALAEVISLSEEKKKLAAQVTILNTELKTTSSKQTAMSDCMKKIEELKKEIDDKDKEIDKIKKQAEIIARLEQDKTKLIREIGDKTKKIIELEKKCKDSEDKCKRTEKQLLIRKDKLAKLEKEEDAFKESSNQKTGNSPSAEMVQVQEKLENVRKELSSKEQELTTAKEDLSSKQQALSKLQDDLTSTKQDMTRLEKDKKEMENNVKAQKKEAGYWESKASECDTDLQAERKKVDRMRINHERDCKNKEAELATLKGKLRTLEQTSGAGTKKISEMKQDFEEKLKKLEHELAVEKQEYEELTAKYEILEEEHVVTKAKLTIDKEAAQGELVQIQRESCCATADLKALKENYNNQSDVWMKEKLELQEKLSVLEDRLCGGGWEVEKARLQAKFEQKERDAKKLAEERDVNLHQNDILRREIDETRTKLDDYEKVHKVQRNLAAENAEMEAELKNFQKKLNQADKMKKNDIVECKVRYEAQMQTMQEEMVSLQGQVSRFRRERDTFKQMLDSTQNAMRAGDGNTRNKRASITSIDELEDAKMRVATLEQQVNCMEDELCEARMDASKIKTELISERSTSEVKLAEMQSKLNEFEEDRLLSSGRTKIPGMRTRMELAWQKERDEQQRLLQETSTLARDLRQTLFEVERERDKERLDMKRRIDQLKRTTEEETDENKKKVTELQCDLLELRDAHAKLRTTNEKLRREKEKGDRDREQNKLLVASLKRSQQDDDRKISYLLEQIEELMKQSPELFKTSAAQSPPTLMTPTPPRRNRSSKSRSREATPESGISDSSIQSTLARLQKATEELKASRLIERQRRQVNMKRAASTEPRDTSMIVTTVTPRSSNTRNPSLKKRSISLEQTTKDVGAIWKTEEDSMSSLQSLDTELDPRTFTMQRDTSLDSRLSGGSTQSDVLPAGDKKKKGLFGKLKKLTKSRSIDDQSGPDVAEFRPIGVVPQGSDSDMSAAGSKRDIRGRLSDMFSRKGQQSRSSSKEPRRELSTPVPERAENTSQRPPSRNGSSTNLRQTTPTSTSSSRTKSTPAMQRKPK